jgi:hypothetical protein
MIGCPGREHYCCARSDQHPFHHDQRRVDAFCEEAAFGGDETAAIWHRFSFHRVAT